MIGLTSLTVFLLSGASGEPAAWCAKPRTPEPLLSEALELGTSTGNKAQLRRSIIGLKPVPRDSIAMVDDEETCRRAAAAYWIVLREFVPDLFGDKPDGPVLVIAVGDVYLVDDLRTRGTYWEVMVFDRTWQRRYGYGGGA